jgi:hypothetical protein
VTADDIEFEPAKAAETLNALLRETAAMKAELKQLRETGGGKTPPADDAEKFFASLDDEGRAMYGTGPTEQLAADSPERAARDRLRTSAKAFIKAKEAVGESLTTEEAMRRMHLTDDAVVAASTKRELDVLQRKTRARAAQVERRPDRGRSGAAEISRRAQIEDRLDKTLARLDT